MDQARQHHPFTFSGSGSEYFKIWIVNLCLSIITLGIYSAWAKVRRLQYFYRNTSVAGASFDYHGDPVAILKGRVLALILFIAYSFAGEWSPVAGIAAFVLIAVLMPWLLVRSLRFRLRYSSWRGLRFAFRGKVSDSYAYFLLLPIAGVMSLYLLWPLVHQQYKRFQHRNSWFGQAQFNFDASIGSFYRIYLGTLGITLLSLIVAALAIAGVVAGLHGFDAIKPSSPADKFFYFMIGLLVIFILYLALLILAMPYYVARMQNLLWNHTSLGENCFESRVPVLRLAWVYFSNLLAIVFTLGLFKPFADVRAARLRVESMALLAADNLDGFVAAQAQEIGAGGEEVAEIFDVDIGL